ncbi:MAG TPA: hypothetical protein PKE40_04025 [Arachnia sp.]|nr:hypothetical protein [Arachnia sp.]HMT85499.1 hypothetical protein [Arachnia sp.]
MSGLTPTDRDGRPATGAADAEALLLSAFDLETGRLTTPTTGRIWEAIHTAQHAGNRGAGRRIAIIDIGFDRAILPAQRIHPKSSWGHVRETRHGTLTALLTLAAAPDAELLLIDVEQDGQFGRRRSADAFARAISLGATVVNISAEFETDCRPRALPPLADDGLLGPDPDPEGFLAQVSTWIEQREPYADPGCRQECRICARISEDGTGALVVAAAGNIYETACPACHPQVVGVGFQRSYVTQVDGRQVTVYGLAETEHGSLLRPELMLDEPPGFLGTSFASPLLAALGAQLSRPQDLAGLAAFAWAATPIITLANQLGALRSEPFPPRAVSTFERATLLFGEALPPDHRHWLQSAQDLAPCPCCALVLVDWYDTTVAIYLGSGDERLLDEAVRLATVAAAIAPFSAPTAGNAAVALFRQALFRQALYRQELGLAAPAGRDGLQRARSHALRALELDPGNPMFERTLSVIETRLAAPE